MLKKLSDKQLTAKAHRLRKVVLEMCIARGGHLASSFSCIEILVTLYYGGLLRFDPHRPDWPARDRFVLSKGHAETAYYAVLADVGFFPASWLGKYYRRGDCRLGGHPDDKIPGVEVSTGALGHGLGLAVGMALAARARQANRRHFVLMGDAECTEGAVWEAALLAAARRLGNLVAIVDRNRIGSIDYTENYSCLQPLADKWRAFGWQVRQCDGHAPGQILQALEDLLASRSSSPGILIAHTVKGKGIDFMENDPIWHVRPLKDPALVEAARMQLEGGPWHGHA